MTRTLLLVSCAVLLGTACSVRSEQELKAEFQAYVAARNQCSSTDECTLASAGCPLGCVVAVNAQHKSSVEQKARELVDEYQSSGRKCEYECALVSAVCNAGRCELAAQ